jgi:DNA-binding SARP family transcriptional activator
MPTLQIFLFGPPHIESAGALVSFHRHQTLALLAYLAAAEQPPSRDTLAALFWPELDEAQAHAALRRGLYDLGRTIGKEWLVVEHERLALRPEAGLRVDVRRFHGLVKEAATHGHGAGPLCDACLAALAAAADLYRGDFLAGFSLRGSVGFDDWQCLTAESLRLELAGVLEKLATGLANRRQLDRALPYARRWLALDPLDEASHRLLMQLHIWTGDRAAAVRQYEACAKALAAELGIEPAAETAALYRTLLRAEPPVTVPVSRAPAHNLPRMSRRSSAARRRWRRRRSGWPIPAADCSPCWGRAASARRGSLSRPLAGSRAASRTASVSWIWRPCPPPSCSLQPSSAAWMRPRRRAGPPTPSCSIW